MFTGLIQKKGRVVLVDVFEESARLCVAVEAYEEAWVSGESIAIDGVCLTLVSCEEGVLSFDVLQETLRLTQLHAKVVGDVVNVERALRLSDRLGGHLVAGHVDGVGVVRGVEQVGRDWMLSVECDAGLCFQMIYKGSIGLNGVSLTLTEVRDRGFSVHLIPVTWEETNLSGLQEGSLVNVEVDPLAKYVKRQLDADVLPRQVEWEAFKGGLEAG